MPMIRGRFYMNPAIGAAVEDARAKSEQPSVAEAAPHAPIHRVEIEVGEAGGGGHGRGSRSHARGYVAHLHRAPALDGPHDSAPGATQDHGHHDPQAGVIPRGVWSSTDGYADGDAAQSAPVHETHVFTNPQDLVNFLRDALAEDGYSS